MGLRVFGDKFIFSDFKGPHGQGYEDRSDLFQQLVGAFLREEFHARATVSATKGQDGGIDAFVDVGDDPDSVFEGLSFPIVVECKYHDDSLSGIWANIQQGWAVVKEKLKKNADEGWPDSYAPWKRCVGYLYCVSAVLTQEHRESLNKSIDEFFASLRADGKTSVLGARVLDWMDIAALLNGHQRLIDNWLGIDLSGLKGHTEYEAELSGFRLYLKEENLSFIPPAVGDPAHPDSVFAQLEIVGSTRGVLVVGAGGVGKTRLCFEVARIADGKGWRVIHLLPGEPAIDMDVLFEAILLGRTPTLLVIDYLDQLVDFDLASIRRRLLPEAESRGIRLAFLTNARPGILRNQDPERDGLFKTVNLDIEDRRESIADRLQRTVAPKAFETLGAERIMEICGTRPLIGLFIAKELERYTLEGRLAEVSASDLRQGDLQSWIQRRLREDGISLKPAKHPLLPPSPDPFMIAASASFAAAPLGREDITQVVDLTLASLGEADVIAGDFVSSLESSGWLEAVGPFLAVAHDVIADELLETTLCDRNFSTARSGVVEGLFVSALTIPRVLGHFSVAVDRVVVQRDFPEKLLQSVRETISSWLARRAPEMGQTYRDSESDEVSYAFGAAVSGIAFGEAILKAWDQLISPWLLVHAQNKQARHLLHRGLKAGVVSLIDTALIWLGKHREAIEAGFVLPPLLSHPDMSAAQSQEAISNAMLWLEKHGQTIEAQFVLAPLLAREDMSAEQIQAAISIAMTWLEKHYATGDAEFVLKRLLGKSHLSDEQRRKTIPFALNRLEVVIDTDEASFLLRTCLSDRTLTPSEFRQVTAHAIRYLDLHRRSGEIDFVFKRLLRNPNLEDSVWRKVADYALEWLRNTPLAFDRDHALNSLLAKQSLLTTEEKAYLKQDALRWLESFPKANQDRLKINLERMAGFEGKCSNLDENGGVQRSATLSEVLQEHARNRTVPEDETLIKKGLNTARIQIHNGRPGVAGYYLSPLVVLAARNRDQAFLNEVVEAIHTFLKHPNLTPAQRNGFLGAQRRFLAEGAWDDEEQARRLISLFEIP